MAMDSSSSEVVGATLDMSKSCKLSMTERREFVYELSKWSNGAPEVLHSWSRQEILQILCAEMGKDRKYTGLTKLKLIENLLKLISQKSSKEKGTVSEHGPQPSPSLSQKTLKRHRKDDHPSQLPVPSTIISISNGGNDTVNAIYCKNSACRAIISQDNAFCKRCSCCICHQYDDNKDPSLWLVCNSDPPYPGDSCGMSCHLECALKCVRSGIVKDGRRRRLDGGFYCVFCGKTNDLLGCCRKQLVMAKDTRRVDILCYRVSLSQKLLKGTEKYQKLYEIMEEAVKKLEADVGPLTGLPVKMGRGIVNRLSSGPGVQKLCNVAMESLDSVLSNTSHCSSHHHMIADSNSISPDLVRIADVRATSLTVILVPENRSPKDDVNYNLWHRKAQDMDFPSEPTCKQLAPNTKFVVSGLTPATEYRFRVSCFDVSGKLGACEVQHSTGSDEDENPNSTLVQRSQSPATNCSSLSNPSSVEDESNVITICSVQNDIQVDNCQSYCKDVDKVVYANLSNDAINCTGMGEITPADPVSLLDGEHVIGMPSSDVLKLDTEHSQEGQVVAEMSTDNGSDCPLRIGMECVPYAGSSEADLPITPCKLETLKDGLARHGKSKSSYKNLEKCTEKGKEARDGSTSKKRSKMDEERVGNRLSDKDFEYCVKVIRCLECDRHIDMNFRQKFLTWYSMRATLQEVRIVKVFVDTFVDDPASLAGQLVDTFTESISSNRLSLVPAGFCMKLWH